MRASRTTVAAAVLLCTVAAASTLLAQAPPSGAMASEPPLLVEPVSPDSSRAVSSLPGVLVSRQLMEARRLAPGDVIALSADASGARLRQFRIVAQYEPTPDPLRLGAVRYEARLHLPDLLDVTADPSQPLDAESVDAINLTTNLTTRQSSDPVATGKRISDSLPGVIAQSSAGLGSRAAPFVVLERFHLAIAIVTVVASSIFLLALMLMIVDERRATVGILRLIGLRRGRILQHVLAEGVVIAVAGALFGIALSIAMQAGINYFFQWRYDTALVFVRITPWVVLRSIAVAIPLGVAAIAASSWSLLAAQVFSLTRR
ncbi:MAG: ABC transporter permease [Vicinamibacterales bacterium]